MKFKVTSSERQFDAHHSGRLTVFVDAIDATDAERQAETFKIMGPKPWVVEATSDAQIAQERQASEAELYQPLDYVYRSLMEVRCPHCKAVPHKRCKGAKAEFDVHMARFSYHWELEREAYRKAHPDGGKRSAQ